MHGLQRTILVVEDNESERDIFSRYLTFVGYEVVTARNGRDGLRLARTLRPDLILLDLTMPVLDGWETIEQLKRDPATAGIPVMALTAHHLDPGQLDQAGFCGYLEKPLAPFRVLDEVERCIGPAIVNGGMVNGPR